MSVVALSENLSFEKHLNLRPYTIDREKMPNRELDLLEGRLSDLGIVDPRRDDPLWQYYSKIWREIQMVHYGDDEEGKRNGWDNLERLSKQIKEKYGPNTKSV